MKTYHQIKDLVPLLLLSFLTFVSPPHLLGPGSHQWCSSEFFSVQEGELFAAHGDFSTDGTRSSAGFIDGCRRATLFVYLNDVPRGVDGVEPS